MKNTALITGASSGIGLEIARLFAADGADVILTARREEHLNALASELEKNHRVRCTVIAVDLAAPNGAQNLCAALEKRGLSVDFLVNNAGFGLFGNFHELGLDEQMRMIQLNVMALTELTRRLLPGMCSRGTGGVWNVASTAGFLPGPLMAVYYATKAYVLSFTEALGNELRGSGVKACALCPGPTLSGFQAAAGLDHSRMIYGKNFLPTSAEVARQGYRAFKKGRVVCITGGMNRLLIFLVRFLPRTVVPRLVRVIQERKR